MGEVLLFSQEGMGHMVVLKENAQARKYFQMFVGEAEFMAIAKEKGLLETPRPLTHETYLTLLKEAGLKVVRVEIFDLRERTFLAHVVYQVADQEKKLDARPSDSVALALHMKIPILVNTTLLRSADQAEEEKKGALDEFIRTVKF